MSPWFCASCTAAYSVGAPRCPQCGATRYVEQGGDVEMDSATGEPAAGSPVSALPVDDEA